MNCLYLRSRIARNYEFKQILRLFVDLPRKIAAAAIFRALPFSVTSLYFSLTTGGFPNATDSAKIVKNRGRNDFLHCTIFRYFWFVLLTRGASEFNKFCVNCEKPWSQRFVALNDFSLFLCCSHLPVRASEFN